MFFFLYSVKYYLMIALVLSYSRQGVEERQKGWKGMLSQVLGIEISIESTGGKEAEKKQLPSAGLQADLSGVILERQPFVSVHVSTYNEKRVIDRLLTAVTSFDYPNFEVIVADDSTDETIDLIRKWETNPRIKISHRENRDGYKGQALQQALTITDKRAEFVLVFDADFIPYPDSISQFLKYFQLSVGSLKREVIAQTNISAVQGYQWHVLNKSENWVTRGIRSEYAGSYVIERSGTEIYHGLKQISGSVYMIRREVLQSIGWGRSITEDFQLTLKLYEAGYKVVYTPYIQAPAEAASTIKRMIRQRMRWAEGHSYNIKKLFKRLIYSPNLTLAEKFELVYLAPYYLQAAFFIVGTLSWFIAETIFQTRLPFWTEVWGWSLVATNLFALPLMNMVGLFMEETEEKDYLGLFSFIALSYIVAPFQAYAAVKGFIEKEEGPWFRTPKTGRITDTFLPGRVYRFVRGMFGRPSISSANSMQAHSLALSPYLALATANNRFDAISQRGNPFGRKRSRGNRFVGKSTLAFVMVITLVVNNLLPLSTLIGNEQPDTQVLQKGLKLQPSKESFSAKEQPSFNLAMDKQVQAEEQKRAEQTSNNPFAKLLHPERADAAEKSVKTELLNHTDLLDTQAEVKKGKDGKFAITLPKLKSFKPGTYTLRTTVDTGENKYQTSQDFSWGVLAINTRKSVYQPGEKITFGFGVLDDLGGTICNAKLH
jgi:glycosyltransferase involved in cell wall biosynthesis